MAVAELAPAEAKDRMRRGAVLVDVRGRDEHARERIEGAVCVPLAELDRIEANGQPVIFHCRTGMRTGANADALAAAAGSGPCYVLAGGLDAWRAAGLPTRVDRSAPIEIMRQVQLAAGFLVLAGVLLGWLVSPPFLAISAFIGAGMMLAGATGSCAFATLLAAMPWNRPAAC